MSAYQCWLTQRERLRETLRTTGDASGAAYLTRHALAQVEQNAMAEQPDDLLRQQAGILFSCCKTSLNLLDISVSTRVWVAQSQAEQAPHRAGWWGLLIACLLAAGCAVYAYLAHQWLLCLPPLAVLVAIIVGWVSITRGAQQQEPDEDRLRVTAKPDTEKLFAAIDAQMKAIDRYMNDFAYLNEQNALQSGSGDVKNIGLLAELMQAVYECEGDARDEAVTAAEQLLIGAGVKAVPFSQQDMRLFNLLPSLTETRTLVPALIAQKDGTLLFRGTAAVLQLSAPSQPSVEAANALQAQGDHP